MFKSLILKGSTLLDVMQIKISWTFVKRDFDMLRILNLPIRT